MTRSIAGAGTRRKKPTTGQRTRPPASHPLVKKELTMKPIAPFAVAAAMSLVMPVHAATGVAAPPEQQTSAASDGGTVEAEETLRGTVATVDERNDKISVRLSANETTDLKVADGLLFNALRYGD